ncbi:hypothetical protein DMUE_0874 [Dictyocoela muelleri]|nr:hypothetical protein DMUE_0874 [Dictyocoela muelleri]
MNYEDQPRTDVDSILLDNDTSIRYICQKGLLSDTIRCIVDDYIVSMKICKNMKYLNGYFYKCTICLKEINLLSGLRINNSSIKLCKYFRCIYKWCENVS